MHHVPLFFASHSPLQVCVRACLLLLLCRCNFPSVRRRRCQPATPSLNCGSKFASSFSLFLSLSMFLCHLVDLDCDYGYVPACVTESNAYFRWTTCAWRSVPSTASFPASTAPSRSTSAQSFPFRNNSSWDSARRQRPMKRSCGVRI